MRKTSTSTIRQRVRVVYSRFDENRLSSPHFLGQRCSIKGRNGKFGGSPMMCRSFHGGSWLFLMRAPILERANGCGSPQLAKIGFYRVCVLFRVVVRCRIFVAVEVVANGSGGARVAVYRVLLGYPDTIVTLIVTFFLPPRSVIEAYRVLPDSLISHIYL